MGTLDRDDVVGSLFAAHRDLGRDLERHVAASEDVEREVTRTRGELERKLDELRCLRARLAQAMEADESPPAVAYEMRDQISEMEGELLRALEASSDAVSDAYALRESGRELSRRYRETIPVQNHLVRLHRASIAPARIARTRDRAPRRRQASRASRSRDGPSSSSSDDDPEPVVPAALRGGSA